MNADDMAAMVQELAALQVMAGLYKRLEAHRALGDVLAQIVIIINVLRRS